MCVPGISVAVNRIWRPYLYGVVVVIVVTGDRPNVSRFLAGAHVTASTIYAKK